MIMGASQADCAILVIDGNTSEFERGFEGGGTKEHAILARSLGVTQICVAVNKLDLVGWSPDRYKEIVEKVQPFLKHIGFRPQAIEFVPISGLVGTNLSERPKDVPALTGWYDGPCLVEILDAMKLPNRSTNKPLRVCVYDYYKQTEGTIIGDCVAAKVESGVINERDTLLLMPLNTPVQVKSIEISKKKVSFAAPGDLCDIALNIPPAIDPNYIKSGNVLCDPRYPIHQVKQFRAQIVVFDIKTPITRGQPVIIFSFSSKVPGRINKLEGILNPKSGETIKANPK
jgi:elongation factor 1 alpha-like protein